MDKIYDVLIVGGGPRRLHPPPSTAPGPVLSPWCWEKLSAGGQIALTEQVDNYPGFDEGIDGFTLGQKMQAQAERFGAEDGAGGSPLPVPPGSGEVRRHQRRHLPGKGPSSWPSAPTPRPLGVADEDAFLAVASTTAPLATACSTAAKTVAVVGGGNTRRSRRAAALPAWPRRSTLIHRRDSLRAPKSITSRFRRRPT